MVRIISRRNLPSL